MVNSNGILCETGRFTLKTLVEASIKTRKGSERFVNGFGWLVFGEGPQT